MLFGIGFARKARTEDLDANATVANSPSLLRPRSPASSVIESLSRLDHRRSADDPRLAYRCPPSRGQKISDSITIRLANSKLPLTRFRPNPAHSSLRWPGSAVDQRIGSGGRAVCIGTAPCRPPVPAASLPVGA